MSKKIFLFFLVITIVGYSIFNPVTVAGFDSTNVSCFKGFNSPENWVSKVSYPSVIETGKDIPVSVTFSNASDKRQKYYLQISNEAPVLAQIRNSDDENISEASPTKSFKVDAASQPGSYNLYLYINDVKLKSFRSKACLLGTIQVYDSSLAAVACTIAIPNQVAADNSFHIKTNIKPFQAGVGYELYVTQDVLSPPQGMFYGTTFLPPNDAIGMKRSLTVAEEDILYENQKDAGDLSSTSMADGRKLRPGDHSVFIIASHEGGLLAQVSKYICTFTKFNVTTNNTVDKTETSSESIPAAGGEFAGITPGTEVCSTDPPGTKETPVQFEDNSIINLKADNLRDTNTTITAIIKDEAGKAVTSTGSRASNDKGFVRFSVDPSGADVVSPDGYIDKTPGLPSGRYSVDFYNSSWEQICKGQAVEFIIKKSTIPDEPKYDEGGNLLASCSVKEGLQTDSEIYLNTVGLEKNQKYSSFLSKTSGGTISFLQAGSSLYSDERGVANFKLGENLPKGEYVASLNDSNNKNVCTSNTFAIGESIREKGVEQVEKEDLRCYLRKKVDPKVICVDSAGVSCDPATGQKGGEGGILTAIGCFPTNPAGLMQAGVKIGVSAGGGIALLMMVFAAFRMITSAGNPETIKKGQEQFASAVIGLLFIIFSVLLLEIIGVDILNLPGFGR